MLIKNVSQTGVSNTLKKSDELLDEFGNVVINVNGDIVYG